MRGPEHIQDGVEEYCEEGYVENADYQGQHHRVAENQLGEGFVALSHHDADSCGASSSYKHAEGRRDIHHRECDRDAAYHVGIGNGVAYHY